MSQLEDDFNKLLQTINAAHLRNANVDETVKIVMDFFMHIKARLETASPEDKAQMVNELSSMYQRLTDTLKKVGESTGMSEQELLAYAENPNNFSPEQWRMMQDSKKALMEFNRALSRTKEEAKEPQKVKSPAKDHKKTHRPSRSKWMRS